MAGCVPQRESTSFPPRGSQVQSLSHPPPFPPFARGARMLATAKALVRSLLAGSDQSMAKQIPEADAKQVAILERVRAYTMTSRERVWGVLQATAYVHAR